MREVDYIIVGLGIAGISFCEQLRKNNKSFVVFDDGKTTSTAISGGVFNPLVLKRFTKTWKAEEFIAHAVPFYETLSSELHTSIFSEIPIYRILSSVEEQNNWTVACDKKEMSPFMFSENIKNENAQVLASYGYGKVLLSGRIQPEKLLRLYTELLREQNKLELGAFNYDLIVETNTNIEYKTVSAKRIVFTEGVAAIHNPYFPKQLLIGNKGEYLIIKAPDLKLDNILKGSLFIIPLGDSIFKVGATYSREDYSLESTLSAKEQIIKKLRQIIQCDYEIIDQIAGIRPTTSDRRPLVGQLAPDSKIAFLNGLGARGILMAPLLGKMLYELLEEGMEPPNEVNITRFI